MQEKRSRAIFRLAALRNRLCHTAKAALTQHYTLSLPVQTHLRVYTSPL